MNSASGVVRSSVIIVLAVVVQPLLSVTVTVYVPEELNDATCVVAPPVQEYNNPAGKAVASTEG